jgi:hypothetical protein
MKIVEFYEENGTSRSRNFLQAGAGAAQKWTGSATLLLSGELKARAFQNTCFSGLPKLRTRVKIFMRLRLRVKTFMRLRLHHNDVFSLRIRLRFRNTVTVTVTVIPT